MKILVAGTYKFPMYQEALCHGISANGHEAICLILGEDRPYNLALCSKNEKRLLVAVKEKRPDALFLYRVENIWSRCLKKLKQLYPNMPIAIYHNDDPFKKGWKRYIKSMHYLACIKYTDITYVYRRINIEEAYQLGAKKSKLFMSHYNSQTDLQELSDDIFDKKKNEVAFIGHYEPDDRIEILDYLFNNGVNLHVYYNGGWDKCFAKNHWPLTNLHPGANGKDYKKLVQEVGIALAFFSAKNRDEYTRRCFEIPIMGTLIAAPITPITKQLYSDGKNALLFSSKEDLLEKIRFYSQNIDERNRVAKNGYDNIRNGDYSEIDRAKMVIEDFESIINYK